MEYFDAFGNQLEVGDLVYFCKSGYPRFGKIEGAKLDTTTVYSGTRDIIYLTIFVVSNGKVSKKGIDRFVNLATMKVTFWELIKVPKTEFDYEGQVVQLDSLVAKRKKK